MNKKIIRSLFTVKEKLYVTPHYLRITFNMTDQQVLEFKNVKIGDNNKLYIPYKNSIWPSGSEETIWESDFFQAVRTYTTRNIDFIDKTLQVDFALHEEKGPASQWAENADYGDFIGIAMKESSKLLVPEADKYFFAGDSTALPVISVILESLPAAAIADVLLEVCSNQDVFILHSRAKINLRWFYNSDPSGRSKLAEEFTAVSFPEDKCRYTFIAGEFEAVKKIKKHIKEQLDWERGTYQAISYWKLGSSENESVIDRQKQRLD